MYWKVTVAAYRRSEKTRPSLMNIWLTEARKASEGDKWMATRMDARPGARSKVSTRDEFMGFKSFLDARRKEAGSVIETDLCIIGSGAAGITIAREFIGSGVRVCLLEAGGLSIDPEVAERSVIESVGRDYPYKDSSRLRLFGGSTNHWGGNCLPLQPIDFEKLDWINYSGWPYGYDELEPYYRRAHAVLGLAEFDYDAPRLSQALGLERFPFDPSAIETVISRYNPLRFGLTFGDELDAAPNMSVMLYAEAIRLNLQDGGDALSTALISTLAGNEFKVTAKYFVLAAGGIENPRILLLSNQQRPIGLGNHSGFVGRLFQEHIWYPSGFIFASARKLLRLYTGSVNYGAINVAGHIAVSPQKTKELRIPRFRAELIGLSNWQMVRDGFNRGDLRFDDIFALLWRIDQVEARLVCDVPFDRNIYMLLNFVQQTPNWNSRIFLSEKKDPLGRPHPALDWRLSSIDHQGIVKAQTLIAQEVGRSAFGRARIEIDPNPRIPLEGCEGGPHQMGTTRMSDNPSMGVTDRNAKVHHVRNLYIAGSSLFPTCGHANPTLTIVATSLRLADHLKSEMRKDGLL
jgi:choline dehydrogenase-like flavoprotein